mmetsp:Transcript_5550/g.10467  ORF Transcript_5550/g.10467 Transcript_5550/m.10467 type:complete len:280 (+) Transcript_5550:706-1545(+)
MECVKVALEHRPEVHKGAHEVLLIRPLAARVENFRGHARARTWNPQIEHWGVGVVLLAQLAAVDGVDDGARVLQFNARPHAVPAPCPAGVHQPGVRGVRVHLLRKQRRIPIGMHDQEGSSEAGGEGGLRLGDAFLRARHLGCVPTHKVVHGLAAGQLAHRRQHPVGVAAEHDDVGGVRPEAGHARVGDEVDGVSGPCVFSHGAVREVHLPRVFGEDDVLQHRPEANSIVDLGLQLGVEVDALGVTSPLDVEDAVLGPAVLVVPNKGPVRVRGQSGFACA